MITNSLAITICIFILGISFSLIKIIYDIIMRKVEAIDKKQQTHSLDIQTLKDFNDIKINRIEKDIMELKSEIKNLTNLILEKIHSDDNFVSQQRALIERMGRILDNRNESIR